MDEMFFKIMYIEKQMESNKKRQTYVKAFGILAVFVIFCFSFSEMDIMTIILLLMSIPIIGLLLGIDVYYIKQNKKLEFKLYQIRMLDLQDKKELADIRGEALPDWMGEQNIPVPSDEISLPIVYYVILIILDIAFILIFYKIF